ncbi:Putative hypothetical protein [Candidatus Glomeribacter gigasporarum BEG34]|uniref:DUF551 domain-containing protein n=1 Tax=Candidatus Glomeribacter gigasporarum BEG34 TaxID=1070319 RepID=G2JB39_9BURK|nr:DUF551 domain-containing protein [Candidatus Glomeribacter gigasporarum]CCD29991.1 Putative hypothetical protein [Candidatus Glomeribacter gigasporarum BEG34]
MNQWIDVSKELPPMGRPVLAVAKRYGGRDHWLCAALRRGNAEDWIWAVSNGELNDSSNFDDEGEYNITHWMLLPELPKRSEA